MLRWRSLQTEPPRWAAASAERCSSRTRTPALPPPTAGCCTPKDIPTQSGLLNEIQLIQFYRWLCVTSRNPFCWGVMWFRGMYMSFVSWHTTIACRWLKVPLPTSCPLMRILKPATRCWVSHLHTEPGQVWRGTDLGRGGIQKPAPRLWTSPAWFLLLTSAAEPELTRQREEL